jgi:hypothetical protein
MQMTAGETRRWRAFGWAACLLLLLGLLALALALLIDLLLLLPLRARPQSVSTIGAPSDGGVADSRAGPSRAHQLLLALGFLTLALRVLLLLLLLLALSAHRAR